MKISDADIAAEKRAKRFWISLIVGLFAIQMTICGIAFRYATGQPSMAVTPNYHMKALKWDEHKAALAASKRDAQQASQTSESDPVERSEPTF